MARGSWQPVDGRKSEQALGHGLLCNTNLLEVGANGEDLVNEVLDREDIVFAKGFLNDSIVGQRDALFVDLAVAALVDQLTNGLQIWLAVEILALCKLILRQAYP